MKRSPIKRYTPLKRTATLRKPKKLSEKVLRKVLAVKKPKKRTVSKLKKELWQLCKEITRARYGNSCYTCPKTGLIGGNWQTGHFIASSVCSTELRYDLNNLRPQCYNCNINKSGNWPAFERRLIAENGAAFVTRLKQRNVDTTGLQYDTLWYEAKIEVYQEILSNL